MVLSSERVSTQSVHHFYANSAQLRDVCIFSKNVVIGHLVMSILFPLVILSKESTTERFYELATWDPYSNNGDTVAASGSPGTTKEAAQGLGPGPWPCPAPWARTLTSIWIWVQSC